MSYKNSGNPQLSALHVLGEPKLRRKIRTALQDAKGNLSDAAESLNISRRTLHRWLARYPELAAECRKQRIRAIKEGTP